MKANYKNKKENLKAEVALSNLYEMNKQLMEKEPELTSEEKVDRINQLANWFQYSHPEEKYYMLLCHELRDYTLFNLDKTNSWKNMPKDKCSIAAYDVIDCMINRGQLLSIDQQEDGVWEIWIRNIEGCFAYYLFPYGEAVLEY